MPDGDLADRLFTAYKSIVAPPPSALIPGTPEPSLWERGRARADELTPEGLEEARWVLALFQQTPGDYHPFTLAYLKRAVERLAEKDAVYCRATTTPHTWLRTLHVGADVCRPGLRQELVCFNCGAQAAIAVVA